MVEPPDRCKGVGVTAAGAGFSGGSVSLVDSYHQP